MTVVDVDTASAAVAKEAKGSGRDINWIFVLCCAWLALVVFAVLFYPWLPFIQDPTEKNVDTIKLGPSGDNWFGTTSLGKDVFAQVLQGGRVSLRVAGISTAVGIIVGGGLGLLAGFFRGWIDSLIRIFINVTLSVPALVLVIFIVAVRDQSLFNVILAVCLLAIPAIARIVRASTLQVADREYVKAAEVIGTKKLTILFREVLPNVMPTLISFTFLTTGIILVAESSLSFLGLSVEAPTITWGSIIAEGRIAFSETPYMVFLPSAVLFLTVLALNFIGDELLTRFDIRESAL